jgi:hypothetical protein
MSSRNPFLFWIELRHKPSTKREEEKTGPTTVTFSYKSIFNCHRYSCFIDFPERITQAGLAAAKAHLQTTNDKTVWLPLDTGLYGLFSRAERNEKTVVAKGRRQAFIVANFPRNHGETSGLCTPVAKAEEAPTLTSSSSA